jgi:hypothetical protein
MHVLRASEDCLAFFADRVGKSGEIHSTFDRAVNLIFDGGILVSIVSDQLDMAPMTCQVDQAALRRAGWKPGNPVLLDSNFIRIQGEALNLTGAKPWALTHDLSLPLPLDEAQKRLDLFVSHLLKHGKPEGLLPYLCENQVFRMPQCRVTRPESNRYVAFIVSRLDQFVTAYRSLNSTAERDILAAYSKIVGFGPGLTPSTDDFAAGFMATAVICPYGQPQKKEKLIALNMKLSELARGKTTLVSETLLYHAAKGHVAEKYLNLIEQLCFTSSESLEKAVDSALSHGDTSGTDFLTGIATAMKHALNDTLGGQ